MGRDATVTFEQIAEVASVMTAKGAKPTSRAVREALGNTGSMGTINKLLQRWRVSQASETDTPWVFPPALEHAMRAFFESELTIARSTLEAEIAYQQKEVFELATENERQVARNEFQQEAIELLRAEVSTHLGRAGQLESDLIVSRDETARERSGADLARSELAQISERVALIEQTAKTASERMVEAQAERDTARKEANAARVEAAMLRGQVDAMKVQAAELVRALADRQAKADPSHAKKR